jgi:hypothetical protein
MSNEHQTNVNSALADWHGSILSGSALRPAFPAHIAQQADLDSISLDKATIETTITAIEAKKSRPLKWWSI